MNISIDSKSNNALLERSNVNYTLTFEGAMPSRKQVREALSMALSIPAERLVIIRMACAFGTHEAKGLAHLYPTPEAALKGAENQLEAERIVERREVARAGVSGFEAALLSAPAGARACNCAQLRSSLRVCGARRAASGPRLTKA